MLRLSFTKILLCLPGWLILIPVLIFPTIALCILYCVRKFVDLIVTKWIHPDWTPIYPPDSVFANVLDKNDSFGNYCAILTFKEIIPFQEIRDWYKNEGLARLQRKSQSYQRISRVPRQCLWFYFWAPVPINVDQIIVQWKGADFDSDFESWLPARFNGNCLYEVLIAHPTTGKYAGRTVLCTKVNHLIGDGVSTALELLGLAFGNEPESELPANPQFIKATWSQVLFHIVTFPRTLLQFYKHQRIKNLSSQITTTKKNRSKMIHILDSVQLSAVKTIARNLRIPFRVILACTTLSAIRRSLLQRGVMKLSQLPPKVGCMIPIVWPYKRKRGFQPLGNNATSMLFLYPFNLESSVQRLQMSHHALIENVETGMHRVIYYATGLSYVLPAPIIKSSLFSQSPATLNSVDIRPMGKLDEPFLGKYKALAPRIGVVALPPGNSNSFAVDCIGLFWSNAAEDEVTVSFSLSSDLIPNEELGNSFRHEIQDLLNICNSNLQNAFESLTISGDGQVAKIV